MGQVAPTPGASRDEDSTVASTDTAMPILQFGQRNLRSSAASGRRMFAPHWQVMIVGHGRCDCHRLAITESPGEAHAIAV